jgi:starch phosphorylase
MAKWQYLTAEAMSKAKALSDWKSNMRNAWPNFAIKDVHVCVNNGEEGTQLDPKRPQLKIGAELSVEALIKLDGISPDDVSIELYHGPVDAWGQIKDGSAVRMDYKQPSQQDGEHWFAGLMPCRATGQRGVAVRILPKNVDLVNPYEMGLILWETLAAKN